MSICSPCIKIKTLNFCGPEVGEGEDLNKIIIGHSIENGDNPCNGLGPYVAYFKSLATGAIYSFPVSFDDGAGYCIYQLEYDGSFPLSNDMEYEVWVGVEGSSVSEGIDIVIGDLDLNGEGCITGSCFSIRSERIIDLETDESVKTSTQQFNCYI